MPPSQNLCYVVTSGNACTDTARMMRLEEILVGLNFFGKVRSVVALLFALLTTNEHRYQ